MIFSAESHWPSSGSRNTITVFEGALVLVVNSLHLPVAAATVLRGSQLLCSSSRTSASCSSQECREGISNKEQIGKWGAQMAKWRGETGGLSEDIRIWGRIYTQCFIYKFFIAFLALCQGREQIFKSTLIPITKQCARMGHLWHPALICKNKTLSLMSVKSYGIRIRHWHY